MPSTGLASRAGTVSLGATATGAAAATVNRLGFGAMRITGPGIWGPPRDVGQARQVLHALVDLGVDFIDTAAAYGPEVSERLIGEALAPYPQGLMVATKSGFQRTGPDVWVPDCRPETIRRDAERSLRLLRTEVIDLLQLHTVDEHVPIEESLGMMVDLQAEGKVRMIGVCNVNLEQLQRARAVAAVVSVQNRYSLDHRVSEQVLDACEAAGLAFLPWFPLGAGSLVRNETVRTIAGNHEATPAQVVLAWLLHRSPVMLPIPGTSSVKHLEENVAAAALSLSPDDLDALAVLGS